MIGLTWLVPVLPLIAYVVLLATGKRMSEMAITAISVLAVLIGLIISIGVVAAVGQHGPYAPVVYNWLAFGQTTLTMGYQVTNLNAMMLLVVTLVSTLVFLFSKSYMHGDERFSRFYQYLNLFVFSMLGLVITSNLLELYIFWELVGVCSYLLVGFWYFKPEAAVAAKKAFIVTRIGDVGLFIGIILLYLGTGSFDFTVVFSHLHHFASAQASLGALGHDAITRLMNVQTWVTLTALLVFVGAVGKSAQFPLHVWLPDAMEGPTPVSALIHAATMVAAGVYLVARMFPLFEASSTARETVAIIGGVTAIFAASIGLTQRDIKRVIAYSTVSQLGYMMLAMGVGAYVSGMFHLMTHAFFKALLFLAAGSVIHALDTQDLFEMGGLRKYMPITHATFLAGALALSGIPPFAGFWSKDDILTATFDSGHYVLYAFGLIAAFFTAVYIFRVYFLTFSGTYKGSKHPHEGGWVMTLPLLVLGLLATFAGFINTPFAPILSRFLQPNGPVGIDPPANWGLMAVSAVVGLLGIGLAYSLYGGGKRADAWAKRMGFLYALSYNKWYIDELYALIIVLPVVTLAEGLQFFDRWIVDGLVRLIGEVGYTGGVSLKYSADGQIQTYGLVTAFGLAALALVALRIGGVL